VANVVWIGVEIETWKGVEIGVLKEVERGIWIGGGSEV
jgi:hypothetical protein